MTIKEMHEKEKEFSTMTIDEDVMYGTCDLHSAEVKKTIAMEECSELIQAISKCHRDEILKSNLGITHEHHVNETEEIADVLLIIESIMYLDMIAPDEVQTWIDYKQKRQMFRDYQTFKQADMYPDDDPTQTGDYQDLAPYFLKCKEVYDEYSGDETKVKNDVPQI